MADTPFRLVVGEHFAPHGTERAARLTSTPYDARGNLSAPLFSGATVGQACVAAGNTIVVLQVLFSVPAIATVYVNYAHETDDTAAIDRRFQPAAPETFDSRTRTSRGLRCDARCAHQRLGRFWALTRYEDVVGVLRDYQTFTRR